MVTKKEETYDVSSLSVLEGLAAVRKRPGMYIGGTGSAGLTHCVWEIIDNAVDEALAGHCTHIELTLLEDGSVKVKDDGRGIPVDIDPKTKLSGVELVMTKLHAGGKFGSGSYAASGGLHGVGASVVNALSARLDVQVERNGQIYEASFNRGDSGVFAGDGPDAKFSRKNGLRTVGTGKKTITGTTVRWWSDPEIFSPEAILTLDTILARARQTAFLVPGLTIRVRDERDPAKITDETFCFEGGIQEFVEVLASDTPVCEPIRLTGSGTFNETVPTLDDDGHMRSKELTRQVDVDIAMRWGSGYDPHTVSFVNVVATPKGGTHVIGFERALTKTLNDTLKTTKTLRASEENVTKDDVFEGLTAVVTVRLPEPQFEGQTKEILGTPAVTKIVTSVVNEQLTQWLTNPPRGAKLSVKTVLDKVAAASRTRIAARNRREVARRASALASSALPAKLVDCRSNDTNHTELFIVEGDSALGTAKVARSSEHQALLPIRGKILNVQKASPSDMLRNTECSSIIQVVGAGSGKTFDLEAVRYGKLIFMADADVDGAHIRCLLLTLVHRYMKPLLEAGRVYSAVPPLHRIEVVGRGRKAAEVIYTYTDAEMKQTVAALTKAGRTVKDPVQRFKGLGEMDAKQLRETTMDPSKRLLRRITAKDAQVAANVFELLMGSDVAPRKEFIIAGADTLDRTSIDA